MKNIVYKYQIWAFCFLSIILACLYWGVIASDKYISKATVVLESPQPTAPSFNIASLLTGSGSNSNADMLILREYLLSFDMMKIVKNDTDFINHYSQKNIDFFSRLNNKSITNEELYKYYLNYISVDLDDFSKVLKIQVSAFDPKIAKIISNLLLTKGEQKMNNLGKRLADEQVDFLEKQAFKLKSSLNQNRDLLLAYQNKKGLISPNNSISSLNTVVAGLEAKLATLNATYTTLSSYQSDDAPQVKILKSERTAIEQQILKLRQRMATQNGDALNTLSAEYKALELKVDFAQEAYSQALGALESTRIEAARKLKQLSIIQEATLPEYSEEPKRFYNIFVFSIIAIFTTLILQMLLIIVKDHRD